MKLPISINAMLVRYDFPELGAHLVPALADLEVDDLSHPDNLTIPTTELEVFVGKAVESFLGMNIT